MPYNDFYSQCLFNCQRITVSINSFLVIITEKNLFDGLRITIFINIHFPIFHRNSNVSLTFSALIVTFLSLPAFFYISPKGS